MSHFPLSRALCVWCALLSVSCASATGGAGTSSGTAPAARVADSGGAGTRAAVDRLADEYFKELIETFPLYGVFAGVPETPNDHLGDNSLAATRAWQKREDAWLAQLQRIDASALIGHGQEATFGVLLETLEASKQSRVCHAEYWPINQQSGFQIVLPIVAQLQPIGSAALRRQALARWEQMPRYIDNEIAALRVGLGRGYSLPRPNAEAVREQLDAILKLAPSRSPFAALSDRDSAPGFREPVVRVVAEQITPAIRRYRDFLVSEYIPHARTTTAIASLPRGTDCYRARVRTYTTVDLDARAVHRLGIEQMAAIEAAMRPIAARSFGTSDLPVVFNRLRTDSTYLFKSRQEIIQDAEAAVARATAAMPRWFGRLPKAHLIVAPCQPYEEKAGCPNSYVPGSPDGSRPGRWRINAGNNPPQPRTPLEGTAFHETIPGHHLQFSLAQERPGAHRLTRFLFFSGFGEGWALYAERLALDMGVYSSDLMRFGELGEQALRAARLVVDPGLHVLGWSRQQALDYMLAHVPESRATLESEVDRYIADPGQATAYMVGRLEIERLRQEARNRLGTAFDIREFHDRVLEQGNVPLSLLRSHIHGWLDAEHAPQ